MKRINLIPTKRREMSRIKLRMQRWIIGCAAYGSLVLLAFVVVRFWRDESTSLATEISRMAQSSMESEKLLETIKPQVAEKQSMLEAVRAVADQPDWSVLLALLGKTVGNEVTLNACQIDPVIEKAAPPKAPLPAAVLKAMEQAAAAKNLPGRGKYLVHIGGAAATQKAVSQFVVRLEESGLFDRVQLIKSDRAALSSDRAISFQVECAIGGEGRGS